MATGLSGDSGAMWTWKKKATTKQIYCSSHLLPFLCMCVWRNPVCMCFLRTYTFVRVMWAGCNSAKVKVLGDGWIDGWMPSRLFDSGTAGVVMPLLKKTNENVLFSWRYNSWYGYASLKVGLSWCPGGGGEGIPPHQHQEVGIGFICVTYVQLLLSMFDVLVVYIAGSPIGSGYYYYYCCC